MRSRQSEKNFFTHYTIKNANIKKVKREENLDMILRRIIIFA